MEGKSLSKKAIIAIVIIAILVIAAISMVVVFLRDQGETEATAIGENSSNSEQTQDAVPENNGDNNQGTATQSEEPQQEEQTTVADNDGATTTNVGTTTPATTTTTAPAQQTTTTTDGSTQVATTTTTETIPTQALTLAWSNMTVSGGELLANLDADVTDVTAPVRLATNILKDGESNDLREYYVKRGDTIYMYIAVNEELAHNPTFTLINNGKEYVMEDSLVTVRQSAENRWDYSVKYLIPEDTDFVDGEITLRVSNIEDKGRNKIPDEDGPTNGHRVFYDGTAPRIIVKGTENINEPDEQYVGDATQKIFSKVSFKFNDNLMLKGEYEVNDTLITGMTPSTWGDANFSVIAKYLVQGENTIRTWDMAGNEVTYTFTYDSIAPVYSKLGILNKTRYVNDVKDLTYAKKGDEVRILISFPEKLAVEPTVKVFGKEYTATYRPLSSNPEQNIYYYMVDFTLDETMPEGEIPFEVYGYADIAGNVGEKLDQTKINRDDYSKVIYDRTKPVVKLEGTGVNNYFRSDVIITAEDANLGTIHLRKNGELIKNYELGTPLTEEGNYEVVMSDKAGNKSEQINFTIDKTAPVITLEGTGVNNNFRTDVKAIIEEANVHNIKYRKDDGRWITVSEKELTFTEEGTYTIEVIDLAYNRTEVTFTIDKTAPALRELRVQNFYNPTGNQNYSGLTQNPGQNKGIAITVNTTELLAKNPIIVIGGKEIEVPVQEPQYNKYVVYVDLTEDMNLVEGEKIPVTVKGLEDAAGNTGDEVTSTGNDNYYVIFDKTAPSIKPTADSVGSEGYYSKIGLTFEDNVGIASYEINGDTLIITNGEISYETLQKYLKEGKNTVTASDEAGNEATFTFNYDITAPKASFVRIQNNSQQNEKYAKVGDKVWVYVTIPNSELAGEPKITINGKDAKVIINENNKEYDYIKYVGELVMTDDMTEGPIKIVVNGYKDLAGNDGVEYTTTTDGSSLILDKTAPGFSSSAWYITVEADKDAEFPKDLLPTVTGNDNYSGTVQPELVNTYVDMGRPSTSDTEYKLQYVTRDEAGNEAYNDVFVIVKDTTTPIIKVDGKDETIEAGSQKVYDVPKAIIEDNADITHDYKVRIVYYPDYENDGHHKDVPAVDTKQPGVYAIIYSYTDDGNNTAREAVVKVTVTDKTKPVITLEGEKYNTLKKGEQYIELGANMTDNSDASKKLTEPSRIDWYGPNGEEEFSIKTGVDTSRVGRYVLFYSYEDASGNYQEVMRVVYVEE